MEPRITVIPEGSQVEREHTRWPDGTEQTTSTTYPKEVVERRERERAAARRAERDRTQSTQVELIAPDLAEIEGIAIGGPGLFLRDVAATAIGVAAGLLLLELATEAGKRVLDVQIPSGG